MTRIAAFSVELNGTTSDLAHIAPDTQSACGLIGLLYVLVNNLEDIQPEEVGTAETQFAFFQCSIEHDGRTAYSYHMNSVFEKKSLIHLINEGIISLVEKVQANFKAEELAVKL